ncbi:MAG: DEAD/DEAH box helicase family protein [Candidatus Puniceispirillaceae bacterium]
MFRELEFQSKVFHTLEAYLEALTDRKANADEVAKLSAKNPTIDMSIPDFTQEAWEALRTQNRLPASRHLIPFSPRKDGLGRPVPNATLKVPTGGGKTWLAVKASSMILNRYLGQNTGFILWIVPNDAIYTQTLKHFKDRDHPYRQAFDRAAAGRVKIFTKTDSLTAGDVQDHLCVMVLMLQAANRQTKETLRMFRDRGDVYGFAPDDGASDKHNALIKAVPNLDYYGGGLTAMVKASLGNALRMIRPVVVMDEGHRAISNLAYETLYGFNPSFVLELTATPKDVQAKGGRNPIEARYANLLVEITGKALDREGMIKMPLMLDPFENADWQTVLRAALDRLDALQDEATTYQAETDRYIRPIMLVQVERTGKDQRDGGYIHAEDVKEYLLSIGFDEAEIAIKTAEQNDLKNPENQDLLSPFNRVRVIITKEALQEGWDCPFAYVLCSLAARKNITAMTQLVGRILRQPHAEKTCIEALDQCYIFTHQAETAVVVNKIKAGLAGDGLADLILEVTTENQTGTASTPRLIQRRAGFQNNKIYLPQVLICRDGQMKPLDYETDILSRIKWDEFDHEKVVTSVRFHKADTERQLTAISLTDDPNALITHQSQDRLQELAIFNPVQVVQQIGDIILNPFVAWSLLERLVNDLKEKGYDDLSLGYYAASLVKILRQELHLEQDRRAETIFKKLVKDGVIQFRLRADGNNWQMPKTIMTHEAGQAYQIMDNAGNPVQKSLFQNIYQTEMNKSERDVAVYLDGQEALGWWHRNVARRDYGLKGWKRHVIYPDFIFSLQENGITKQLVALETKGNFLDGTIDTEYKRAFMSYVTQHFSLDHTTKAGSLELEQEGVTMSCDLVLLDECQTVLEQKYFSHQNTKS